MNDVDNSKEGIGEKNERMEDKMKERKEKRKRKKEIGDKDEEGTKEGSGVI